MQNESRSEAKKSKENPVEDLCQTGVSVRIFQVINEDLKINAPPQGLANTTGVDVANLQKALEALGYSVGSTGVDGIYGKRTARAVREFQKDQGLTVDGDAGPNTVSELLKQVKEKDVDVNAASPSDVKSTQMSSPSVVQRSRKPGIEGKVLDLIAAPESAGRYDAIYPNDRNPAILDASIKEVLKNMKERAEKRGSSATGRYQYTYDTLRHIVEEMNLDTSTPFNRETQDTIALYHLKNGHGFDQWKAGRMSSRQFLQMLSRTWAGLPDPETGASFYRGVMGNKANISAKGALRALEKIRRSA
jgi:peptidoglycan hydrolase-like protein with peptidoglycan-binding domain